MKKSLATNKFSVIVTVPLPSNDQHFNRWLNLQWAGKELIPLSETIQEKHREAAYRMHGCRAVKLSFEIKKNGNWVLTKAKF